MIKMRDEYDIKNLNPRPNPYADKLKKHLGCAVRLTSGVTHANGRHTKGVLEIDFFDNDDLDRVIKMIGLDVN